MIKEMCKCMTLIIYVLHREAKQLASYCLHIKEKALSNVLALSRDVSLPRNSTRYGMWDRLLASKSFLFSGTDL